MSSNTEIQIKGLDGLHKNTTIEFTEAGLKVTVSLLISSKLKNYLHPNFVFKASKHYVYVVFKHIPSSEITKTRVYDVQSYLLHNAMINCREAKKKMIDDQIKRIKNHSQLCQLKLKLF
jgi:hypothetical protein